MLYVHEIECPECGLLTHFWRIECPKCLASLRRDQPHEVTPVPQVSYQPDIYA